MRKAALNTAYLLAQQDERVVFIGSDLGAGTLAGMKETLPERFFMEGIAEQNLVGMAAGMAMEGLVPFVNTIATFLTRRCFEQIAVDLCLQNLPVRLIANGGGVVYAPLGSTHLALEDIGILRALPNITILAPSDAKEMIAAVKATASVPGPVYIRLGKGGDPVIFGADETFAIGKASLKKAFAGTSDAGRRVGIISTGVMTHRCLQTVAALTGQGLDVAVLHLATLKPLDEQAIRDLAASSDLLVTVEEHCPHGGLHSAVLETLHAPTAGPLMPVGPVLRLSLPDAFPTAYGSQEQLLELAGLDPDGITRSILRAAG